MVSIAVSFLVMIISVAVSSGFRAEIRKGISEMAGDIQMMTADMNYISESSPIKAQQSYSPKIEALREVKGITPAVYRAGIVKKDTDIQGVLFKGTPKEAADSVKLGVSIPSRLAKMLDIHEGDKLLSYFVGSKFKVRNFTVTDVYDGVLDGTDNMIVLADIKDLQRLNGWEEDEVSVLEVSLKKGFTDQASMKKAATEVSRIAFEEEGEDDDSLVVTSVISKYPQIFDWLNLIDFNVLFILILMTVVAGFNMISGLLIMLFRNISTIGILKSMGMSNKSIAEVFLRVASSIVLKGMLIGNAIAFLFCGVQRWTHLLKLNPENYFVSFVPVHLNIPGILAADLAAWAVIMLLLLIPCLFISTVDPAKTVRAQ